MKQSIIKMYNLREQIQKLEQEVDLIGESIFGSSYEGCNLEEELLCVYEDCGHEVESDEYYYNEVGEELV